MKNERRNGLKIRELVANDIKKLSEFEIKYLNIHWPD
jgi:hypothetical protein